MGLRYVKGDVTDPWIRDDQLVFIPHVCNNMRRFGAGVSGAIGRKWPDAERVYRQSPLSIRLGEIVTKHVESNIYVVHMIAQHDTINNPMVYSEGNHTITRPPIRYGALAEAMNKTREFISLFSQDTAIACPMFGAGLSGGDWLVIEALILELWVDHGIDITIYTLD